MKISKKIVILLFLTILHCFTVFAQNDTLSKESTNSNISDTFNRNSVSIMGQFFGPELVGLYVNYFVLRNISINAGLGYWSSAHLGLNYYLLRNHRSGLYIGTQICRIPTIYFNKDFDFNGETQTGYYFPVGLELNSKSGFIVSLEAGYNLVKEDVEQSNTRPFLFALRIGGIFLR